MSKSFFTFEKMFGGIFLSIGLIFFFIGIGLGWNQYVTTADWKESTGTVIGYRDYSSTTTAVVIEFTAVSGRQSYFSPNFGSNPPLYDVGDTVSIWMHPTDTTVDPQLNSIFATWLLPGIFSFMGSIFATIGGGTLLWHLRQVRNTEWARQSGQPIAATFAGVTQKTNIQWNGTSPFVVVAQWHDEDRDTVFVFESEHLWYDPSQFIQPQQEITVFIDPISPSSRYWMDIGFLPQKAT